MKMKFRLALLAAAAVAAVGSGPVLAQKSKDTMRIAMSGQIRSVDLTVDPRPETSFAARWVHDTLLFFDERELKFRPLLAKSWRYVNPLTIEFDLRDDIRYQDGSVFDADDVVYTLNWMTHPKMKSRAKRSWTWVKRVEKLGPWKVRFHAKRPTGDALLRLAYTTPIYPSDVHATYKVKSNFGKKPVGTGPYKAISVNIKKGEVVLVPHPGHKHGGTWKVAANIGRLVLREIPSRQTQVAQLFTGGVDVIRNPVRDQVPLLRKDPRFNVAIRQNLGIAYMSMDALNRSGAKPLSDVRVRRALAMTLDRKKIANVVFAGGRTLDGMCLKLQFSCAYSTKPPPYDPVAAKKLLAEAGYPNGFDVEITALTGLLKPVGEAMSGAFRKIGVRAKVQTLSFGVYRKKSNTGKLQVLAGWYTSGGLPDGSMWLDFFFSPTGRNYWRDKEIDAIRRKGNSLIDPDKRRAIFKEAFDLINKKVYMVPISTTPAVIAHTQEIRLKPGGLQSFGATPGDFFWK